MTFYYLITLCVKRSRNPKSDPRDVVSKVYIQVEGGGGGHTLYVSSSSGFACY